MHQGWSTNGSVRNTRIPDRDPSRRQRGFLSRPPINGITAVVAGREIDKGRRPRAPQPLNDDVPHKQLPVILMRDHVGVVLRLVRQGLNWCPIEFARRHDEDDQQTGHSPGGEGASDPASPRF